MSDDNMVADFLDCLQKLRLRTAHCRYMDEQFLKQDYIGHFLNNMFDLLESKDE